MDTIGMLGLIVLGSTIANRLCDLSDYIYKQKKVRKIIEQEEGHYSYRMIDEMKRLTVEQFIRDYGNLL